MASVAPPLPFGFPTEIWSNWTRSSKCRVNFGWLDVDFGQFGLSPIHGLPFLVNFGLLRIGFGVNVWSKWSISVEFSPLVSISLQIGQFLGHSRLISVN